MEGNLLEQALASNLGLSAPQHPKLQVAELRVRLSLGRLAEVQRGCWGREFQRVAMLGYESDTFDQAML